MTAFVLLYFGSQIYWLIDEGGNVIIYATNTSNLEDVTIDVMINGETVFTSTHNNEKLFDYKRLAIFSSFGKHEITAVVQNKGISRSKTFVVPGVKWINVEFVNDEQNPNEYEILLSVESSPIVIE